MPNVFTKEQQPTNKPKRNVFDLSFANNLTLQFGALTPCFVKEVIPGDSFRIEPRMALKLMPMTFPVQTDMRAYVHFFYVRNRNLWKDWVNFIGAVPNGTESMTKYDLPYLDFSQNGQQVPRTGSLCDYMGIPTTVVGRYGSEEDLTYRNNFGYDDVKNAGNTISYQSPRSKISSTSFAALITGGSQGQFNGDPIDFYLDPKVADDYNYVQTDDYERLNDTPVLWTATNKINYGSNDFLTTVENGVNVVTLNFNFYPITDVASLAGGLSMGMKVIIFGVNSDGVIVSSTFATAPVVSAGGSNQPAPITFTIAENLLSQVERFYIVYQSRLNQVEAVEMTATPSGYTAAGLLLNTLSIDLAGDAFVQDLDTTTSPYFATGNNDEEPNALKINALPFRAYESVYNAFYRDPRNNPYILDGNAEYNKWCPTVEGGSDESDYELHFRNWEADFLTTALPSPQQGQAPLVGVTNAGTLAFRDDEGTVYNASLEYSDDGEGLKGINVHASTDPVEQVTRIVDFATSGIAIADLRGVNALQRWLEINARRGFRYKDQVKSHFDVDIRFDELDMPEFIGGMSSEIYVNQISQTVNQSDNGTWQDTLGTYAGQGFTRNVDAKPISHYFDEHGYVIGIISVVPIPCYSQLLPKHFLKRSPLDYYFPEFGKLGMQPITYSEVCPIQTVLAENYEGLVDTFGYQRAWYDYLASTDEVHGLFRLNMRNFLINRVFDKRPQLSEDFLTVNPQQINNVFSVTETSDKIFGQLYFKVTAQRPIPEYGIPALE